MNPQHDSARLTVLAHEDAGWITFAVVDSLNSRRTRH